MKPRTALERLWTWLFAISVLFHAISWNLGFSGGWVAPYEVPIGWLALCSFVGVVGFGIALAVVYARRK
jgi:hypothetical protein